MICHPLRSLQGFILFTALMLFPLSIYAIEKQIVAGAGPSTKIVTKFFELFSSSDAANNYKFEVPQRSVKHAGGIKASDKYIFGRTGRPLNAQELNKNKREIFLAIIPISFVTGNKVNLRSLSKDQLKGILKGNIKNWKDVGGPNADIILVGREKTEASLTVLRESLPYIDEAIFSKIFTRDHRVVNFIKSPKGNFALAFGVKPNLDNLNILTIEGLEAGIDVGLVYDLKNDNHPIVKSVKIFARSKTWHNTINQMGYLAPL